MWRIAKKVIPTTTSPLPHRFAMIYIAAEITGKAPQTQAFSNKGLSGLTQSRVSDVILFGKPTYNQVAFSGYKGSIEAFLLSTASRVKVSTKVDHFPIPVGYPTTVPLQFPPIIFKLAKQASAEFIRNLLEGWERFGVKQVDIGKGSQVFTMERPSLEVVRDKVAGISLARGPTVAGYAQVEAAVDAIRIYQCVDLFLATNTYYYKKEDDEVMSTTSSEGTSELGKVMELRSDSNYWRPGFSTGSVAKEWSSERTRISALEPVDLTPQKVYATPVPNSVLVAKPSPKPASTSFGPPSAVPSHPGLLFPYFAGMLAPDAAGLRELFVNHFFRNLGSSTVSAKQAFLTFRSVISTFAHTPQGTMITHVLKGIDLALDTQTHLFLIFDDQIYLGFCLLGEAFSIFAHGKFVEPLGEQELRAELLTLQTHSKSLDDLAARLRRCVDAEDDQISVEDNELRSMTRLGYILSTVALRDDEEDEKELSEILARLSFPTRYKTFKPANIVWLIDQLTSSLSEPMPEDLPLFIPLKGWQNCGSKTWQTFAAFGPRGPSFRNSTGMELKIGKVSDSNVFSERDEKGVLKYPLMLVGEKVIGECVRDWKVVLEKGSVKMDFRERAAGSRLHTFRGDQLTGIWNKLREEVTAGNIAVGKGESERGEKRKHIIAFGDIGHEDFDF
jgi:hypothetical protein